MMNVTYYECRKKEKVCSYCTGRLLVTFDVDSIGLKHGFVSIYISFILHKLSEFLTKVKSLDLLQPSSIGVLFMI